VFIHVRVHKSANTQLNIFLEMCGLARRKLELNHTLTNKNRKINKIPNLGFLNYMQFYCQCVFFFSSGAHSPEIRNAEISKKKKMRIVILFCMELGGILCFLKQSISLCSDPMSQNREGL